MPRKPTNGACMPDTGYEVKLSDNEMGGLIRDRRERDIAGRARQGARRRRAEKPPAEEAKPARSGGQGTARQEADRRADKQKPVDKPTTAPARARERPPSRFGCDRDNCKGSRSTPR